MLNVLVFGMDPQQAVEAPRFAAECDEFVLPPLILPWSLAPRRAHPEAVAQQLAALGHEIVRVGACGIGAIVTQRDPDTGVLAAGADPRDQPMP